MQRRGQHCHGNVASASTNTSDMKRIVLVTDGITPHVTGGMQRHSKNLLDLLLKLGWHVLLIHPRIDGLNEREVKAGLNAQTDALTVSLVGWKKYSWLPGGYILENWVFSRMCKNEISRNSEYKSVPVISKGMTGLALVQSRNVWINLHGYEMYQKQFSLLGSLQSLMLRFPVMYLHRFARGYFSYGKGITRICEKAGISRSKQIEIPGAVDESWIVKDIAAKAPSGSGLNFVFVGRNERRKGLEELMRAWEVLQPSESSLSLVGPHAPETWGHPKNVSFAGEIHDSESIQKILDANDVLLCPSYSEGMPNVIMEGMARGLAVIATDVGAVSTLVDDGNGILLPEVSVSGIAKAMKQLETMNDEQMHELKTTSLQRIKRFTWRALEPSYQRFLDARFSD